VALVEVVAPDRLASGLRAAHLDALDALVRAATGARVRLPAGVVVERGRDALWVLRPDGRFGTTPLVVPGAAAAGPMLRVTAALEPIAGSPGAAPHEAWFDAEALGLLGRGASPAPALVVRPSRTGERVLPFGGREPVRLGKLLASAGVPRLARARWPVVARSDGEILWVVGVRRAAAAPLTLGTRFMLRLEAMSPADVQPGV
jgi:tRNA(Ile)-lysidine synthetase-like protein